MGKPRAPRSCIHGGPLVGSAESAKRLGRGHDTAWGGRIRTGLRAWGGGRGGEQGRGTQGPTPPHAPFRTPKHTHAHHACARDTLGESKTEETKAKGTGGAWEA